MIKYSIIICLHNDFTYLNEQLSALKSQNGDLSHLEIVIVDNASTHVVSDNIKKIINNYKTLRIKYVYESKIGAQIARNKAISESNGDLLLYLDDDALPSSDWFLEMTNCYNRNNRSVIQGRIILQYRKMKPLWLSDHLEMLLSKIDLGDSTKDFNLGYVLCNMAIPRSAFNEIGNWDTRIGRKGHILLSGEDAEFAMRLANSSSMFEFIYCGRASVDHVVRSNRYKKSFFHSRSYWGGVTNGYLMKNFPHTHKFSNSFIRNFKIGIGSLIIWLSLCLFRNNNHFTYKCRIYSFVGFLYGYFIFKGI